MIKCLWKEFVMSFHKTLLSKLQLFSFFLLMHGGFKNVFFYVDYFFSSSSSSCRNHISRSTFFFTSSHQRQRKQKTLTVEKLSLLPLCRLHNYACLLNKNSNFFLWMLTRDLRINWDGRAWSIKGRKINKAATIVQKWCIKNLQQCFSRCAHLQGIEW